MQNFCGTKTIHEKMTQVNILRLYMSSLRNKVNCTDQIEEKQHTLKVKQDLPTTVKKQQNSSRRLKNKYKQCVLFLFNLICAIDLVAETRHIQLKYIYLSHFVMNFFTQWKSCIVPTLLFGSKHSCGDQLI